MNLPEPRLLLITDRRLTRRPLAETVDAAFAGGCRWLMVREKDLGREELVALCRELVGRARPLGATVLVNGDARVAAGSRAAGVHLPQGGSIAAARAVLGEGRLVGMSVHSREEVEAAVGERPDYLLLSPVFASLSKPGHGPPLGADGFAAIARGLAVPVLALGGVTAENAAACREAGAAGIAVTGAVLLADDPEKAARSLIAAFAGGTESRVSRASRSRRPE